VDGTGEHKLTRSSRHNVLPAWSPDDSKILFERYGGMWSTPDSNGFIRWIHNGKLDLYTIDPGSGRKQKFARIENERDHCACAAWSPDGSQIVYEAAGTKGRPDIYVMNADGSGRQRLTHDPARDENPDWSPDGSQIAFYSERSGDAEIYIMNTDGTKQHRITRDPWYDQAVRWKPAPNGG
jgi:Tol biopolymer transport system component